ncbi:MAG: HD-GYP domain-containing protein [Pseudomonadales bacterium]
MGKFVKIPAHEVALGMFVAELDCPWEESPFLLQGFTVNTVDERKQLIELCSHVVVDSGKSAADLGDTGSTSRGQLGRGKNRKREVYTDQRSFDEEIINAREVFKDFEYSVDRLFVSMRGNGTADYQTVKASVDGIVSSIINNPDACLLLQKMRRKGDYLFDHATGTSIWAAAFGRQLGLPKSDISDVCLAALMCDVGMISVPDDIIGKESKLSEQEFELVQGHVVQSLNHMRTQSFISKKVLMTVQHHHERIDGSGYPAGLAGDDIPLTSRIVAIADTYDAMSNHRAYACARSPAEAVRELYSLRSIKFQEELIEEFIQAVGIYPVGTLVEISSGEVGMVLAEYRGRRLRPKIVLLADEHKEPVTDNRTIDLANETRTVNGKPLEIVRSLEEGAFGIATDDLFI